MKLASCGPDSARPIAAAIFCVGALASLSATAAETEPFYAWGRAPADSGEAVNAILNGALQRGLDNVNRRRVRSCDEAVAGMIEPLALTTLWYFVSPMREWRLDTAPSTNGERDALAPSLALYRYAPLLPLGKLVPPDPSIRIGEVILGTDKISHFFENGLRYFRRYREVRAAGGSEREAVRSAIFVGIEEERGWLGMSVSGVFSYADLYANESGLSFYRELCEEGGLVERNGRWTLRTPFELRRWANPCWDESFEPNGYSPENAVAVRRALLEMCPLLSRDDIQERRRRYRSLTCPGMTRSVVLELLAAGTVPNPTPGSIDAACAGFAGLDRPAGEGEVPDGAPSG